MLRNEMQSEGHHLFQEWISSEWNRCDSILSSLEGQGINYLMTANGGAAAAVIAFAGSAGYATTNVKITLGCFLLGLLLTGLAILAGHNRMTWITRSLGNDHRAFNKGVLRSGELGENHHLRFKRRTYGLWMAYGAFASFILGLILSVITFDAYVTEKAQKAANKEKETPSMAAPVKEAAIQPTVVRPGATAKGAPSR